MAPQLRSAVRLERNRAASTPSIPAALTARPKASRVSKSVQPTAASTRTRRSAGVSQQLPVVEATTAVQLTRNQAQTIGATLRSAGRGNASNVATRPRLAAVRRPAKPRSDASYADGDTSRGSSISTGVPTPASTRSNSMQHFIDDRSSPSVARTSVAGDLEPRRASTTSGNGSAEAARTAATPLQRTLSAPTAAPPRRRLRRGPKPKT